MRRGDASSTGSRWIRPGRATGDADGGPVAPGATGEGRSSTSTDRGRGAAGAPIWPTCPRAMTPSAWRSAGGTAPAPDSVPRPGVGRFRPAPRADGAADGTGSRRKRSRLSMPRSASSTGGSIAWRSARVREGRLARRARRPASGSRDTRAPQRRRTSHRPTATTSAAGRSGGELVVLGDVDAGTARATTTRPAAAPRWPSANPSPSATSSRSPRSPRAAPRGGCRPRAARAAPPARALGEQHDDHARCAPSERWRDVDTVHGGC